MNYSEALEFIHSAPRLREKPTLERMRCLMRILGDPQDKLKYVHVAGTNGKGSVTAMIASITRSADYKTGRFISPYIYDFRERMEIDGVMISEDELSSVVEKVAAAALRMKAEYGMEPIEFELVCAAGFLYFAAHGCDMVVLEVGLGGRFDPTNIIAAPLVSVIMRIDFDHTELLGDTIEQIAYEKCGIIKRGSATISYPDQYSEANSVIHRVCSSEGSRLIIPDTGCISDIEASIEKLSFKYKGTDYSLRLTGMYQIYNSVTAIEAAEALSINNAYIIDGLAKTAFPARFEVLRKSPYVIFDGAHNASGIASLCDNIKNYFPDKKINLLVGMLKDKHPGSALKQIFELPQINSVHTVTVNNSRTQNSGELCRIIKDDLHFSGEITAYGDVTSALSDMIVKTGENDPVICFGSLYLASDIKKSLSNITIKP